MPTSHLKPRMSRRMLEFSSGAHAVLALIHLVYSTRTAVVRSTDLSHAANRIQGGR